MASQGLSLNSALTILANNPPRILAGGTDFYPALGDSQAPASVLDITRIDELQGITSTAAGVRIGAGTTWTQLINADLPDVFDGLKAAAKEVGSVQIQNAGTLAGNLCNASPAADGVPPLLALDASVELASSRGRRQLKLSEFIVGPRSTRLAADELLVAVHIPALDSSARSGFYKLGSRKYLVISIVMAGVTLLANEQGQLTHVNIAVGSCSAVAQHLTELEKALEGQCVNSDIESLILPAYFEQLAPIDDVRSSAGYRTVAAFEVTRRLILSTIARLPQYTQPDHLEQNARGDV